jgi:hypothetical protein
MPIPVATRSNAWVCGSSRAEIEGSCPAWCRFVCLLCALSRRGLCDELITRQEESYRLRCVAVCDMETSKMKRSWPALAQSATEKKKIKLHQFITPVNLVTRMSLSKLN